MTRLGRLWRTVRHLRREQIVGRVRIRLTRPRVDNKPAPERRDPTGAWIAPPERRQSLFGAGDFCFLNERHRLAEIGWDDDSISKLWRYNLHYFDDLNARERESRRQLHEQLIHRWITENPPGVGTGWEPYPTSLRIVNWVKWSLGGASLDKECLDSLATQVRWLTRRLEFHLLGNHLFVNAKALVFAGLFFGGQEANGWLVRGAELLLRELREQILSDGGHFELSPMYHALILEDVLDLINVLNVYGSPGSLGKLREELERCAPQMLYWLRCMCHPDGTYSHFNDCAQGIAPTLTDLEFYSDRLGIRTQQPPSSGVVHLQSSGYVRVRAGAGLVLFDAGPVGPSYLPGHAHADTLSFELSLGSRRVLLNAGTSCYGTGEQRQRERGTAAHNTVEVDRKNSSEVWSGFRVGRRAYPKDLKIDGDYIKCSHDGYAYLPGRPIHRRELCLRENELVVRDEVTTKTRAVAHYHLAPGLSFQSMDESSLRIVEADNCLGVVTVERGRVSIEQGTHAPEFGILVNTEVLTVELVDGKAQIRWTWH